jgi:hypothetical protein
MIEGALWREARWMVRIAQMTAHLLSPHLKEGTYMPHLIDEWLGGDPVKQVLQGRAKRLARMEPERGTS